MELYKASNQWANRPADERFWTLKDAAKAALNYRRAARTKAVPYGDLRVEKDGEDLALVGRAKVPAKLTHWSFGQISSIAGAPPSYLRTLPPTLAAQNINHGLKAKYEDSEKEAQLLFHSNGGLVLRAAVSQQYERIWNHEVFDRMLALQAKGWRTPPAYATRGAESRPATQADIEGLPTSIEVGDLISPSGIYASDHDMFVFMISADRSIEDGKGNALSRGFFCWNSEVGATSLGVMTFYFAHVCGNHIVWNASGVRETRIRHVGDASRRWQNLQAQIKAYADESVSEDQAKILASQKIELGSNKEEVLDTLFGLVRKKRIDVSQRLLGQAYDRAEERRDRYGAPTTAWGMVNGLTELSQETPHADDRVRLDRAAGKLLEVVF